MALIVQFVESLNSSSTQSNNVPPAPVFAGQRDQADDLVQRDVGRVQPRPPAQRAAVPRTGALAAAEVAAAALNRYQCRYPIDIIDISTDLGHGRGHGGAAAGAGQQVDHVLVADLPSAPSRGR